MTSKHSIAKLATGVVLGLAGSVLFVYLARNPIATQLLAFALERNDRLSCTHPELDIASSLSRITVAPVHCVFHTGPLRAVTIESDTLLFLTGLTVQRIEMPKATFDQRQRDISGVDTDAASALAQFFGFGDQLIKGILDASELYAADSPPVLIRELTMKRNGKTESVMHGFQKTVDGEWNRSHARRVQSAGDGPMTVRDLDMRVTPSRGQLNANVYLGTAEAGDKPAVKLKLDGRHLNAPRPQFSLELAAAPAHDGHSARPSR